MFKKIGFKGLKSLAVLMLLCVTGSVSANISWSDSGLGSHPDIFSSNLVVDYNTSSGGFSIAGTGVGSYVNLANGIDGFIGNFALNFSVDDLGAIDNAGSFSLIDTGNSLGFGTNLLSGSVVDFGFDTSTIGVLLEIASTSAMFDIFGSSVGINIITSSFSLASDFDDSDVSSDTYKVPEPSVLVLFTMAGIGFFSSRKLQG